MYADRNLDVMIDGDGLSDRLISIDGMITKVQFEKAEGCSEIMVSVVTAERDANERGNREPTRTLGEGIVKYAACRLRYCTPLTSDIVRVTKRKPK